MIEFFKAETSVSVAMGGGDTSARDGGSTLKQSEKGPDLGRVARATQTGQDLGLDQGRVA